MKKVLHITNWYPNRWNDLDGIFIKEQFKLFSEVTDSHLVNVQVKESEKLLSYKHISYSENEEGFYIFTKIKSNKIIELLTTLLLIYVLFKKDYKKYDLLHFHIAYPLLMHYHVWKNFIQMPLIISEHWSAYHFNFYMPWGTKKLDGIKRIFRQNIPVITVSKALLDDIQRFANSKDFKSTIIPNIINHDIFFYQNKPVNTTPIFFIVNVWSKIKNPFPLLKGFAKLNKQGKEFYLHIGGDGELIDGMKEFVKNNRFEDKVTFIGKMNKKEIALEYSNCDAYLFSSKYETFSVVCAEALCCGIPLIGPKIDAILEYTRLNDIIIVKENDYNSWNNALNKFIKHRDDYNREEISTYYSDYFSTVTIQNRYKIFIEGNIQ